MYKCASALALAGLLYSADGNAQNRNLDFSDMRDGVVMTGGQVKQIRNGEATLVEDEVTLRDGTMVQADGTVVKSDGTEQQLRNGRAVNERGHIVSARHDMLSYEAILRHEHQKLGDEASPLAKAVGQEDTFAMERVGRFGGFEGDPDPMTFMTEEQTEQFRQAEQQSMANQQHMQMMEQKFEILNEMMDLTSQRLQMIEGNLSAHRRIDLPAGIDQIDQQIQQVEEQLKEVEGMIDIQPAGQPNERQQTTSPGYNNQATPTEENE